MLGNDGNLTLRDCFLFDQTIKDKYDTGAHELIASRLIIRNSLSPRTWSYLKDQYEYSRLAYAMITSFETDICNGGNKHMNNSTNAIVSIHLADFSNKCSKHNDKGSGKSFESIAND